MHKFHDGLLPSIYNGLFQRSSDLHNYNTRYASNQNYFIPSVHSNIGKKLISYKGAVIWREIKRNIKVYLFTTAKNYVQLLAIAVLNTWFHFQKWLSNCENSINRILFYICLPNWSFLNQYWWTFVLMFWCSCFMRFLCFLFSYEHLEVSTR